VHVLNTVSAGYIIAVPSGGGAVTVGAIGADGSNVTVFVTDTRVVTALVGRGREGCGPGVTAIRNRDVVLRQTVAVP
jgi:hypothetical protein